MLSRTADHIYWMGRYIERAETLARALDVQYQLSLLPQTPDSIRAGWLDTLDELGLLPEYLKRHGEVTVDLPPLFVAHAGETSLSIRGCLQAARENARAVRGVITSEMWETLNATWIELRDAGSSHRSISGIQHFIEWVKHRSQLLRGVWQGTMLRDEGYAFLRMGTALERADGTARILGARLATSSGGTAIGGFYQWGVLLRAMSAFENYRKLYRDLVLPDRVAELLVLCEDEPRSLRRAVHDLYTGLGVVANQRSRETERRAGALDAMLQFGSKESVSLDRLRALLDDCVERLKDIDRRVARDFLVAIESAA